MVLTVGSGEETLREKVAGGCLFLRWFWDGNKEMERKKVWLIEERGLGIGENVGKCDETFCYCWCEGY
jgi:hypothetical protein